MVPRSGWSGVGSRGDDRLAATADQRQIVLQHRRLDPEVVEVHHRSDGAADAHPLTLGHVELIHHAVERGGDHRALPVELRLLERDLRRLEPRPRQGVGPALLGGRLARHQRVGDDVVLVAHPRRRHLRLGLINRQVERPRIEFHQRIAAMHPIARPHQHLLHRPRRLRHQMRHRVGPHLPRGGDGEDQVGTAHRRADHRERDLMGRRRCGGAVARLRFRRAALAGGDGEECDGGRECQGAGVADQPHRPVAPWWGRERGRARCIGGRGCASPGRRGAWSHGVILSHAAAWRRIYSGGLRPDSRLGAAARPLR